MINEDEIRRFLAEHLRSQQSIESELRRLNENIEALLEDDDEDEDDGDEPIVNPLDMITDYLHGMQAKPKKGRKR